MSTRQEKNLKKVDGSLLKDIVNQILKITQPEKIILFGSYARDEATAVSDIDILIIQHSDLPRCKRSIPVRLALRGFFPSKDIVIYTPEEVKDWESASTSFIASVLREGRVLYERE
ncbi:MAG: nucleotidyltransferase domain-containing protein [bacterium]|nr:nucleotidyltransferase domain-containing protein [bacterium]